MKYWQAFTGVLIVTCLAWQVPQSGQPQSRRGYEISDYYRTAFPGSPDVSRDGKYVAFAVRRYNLQQGKTWSELWIMGPDGSGLRQMTFADHEDTSPVFSPDGKRLVFVSDRDGTKPQLFVLALDGGEPRKLTGFPMGVSSPRWSPDGRWIAVTSHVYPECGANDDCNRQIDEGLAKDRLQAHVADGLLYRH